MPDDPAPQQAAQPLALGPQPAPPGTLDLVTLLGKLEPMAQQLAELHKQMTTPLAEGVPAQLGHTEPSPSLEDIRQLLATTAREIIAATPSGADLAAHVSVPMAPLDAEQTAQAVFKATMAALNHPQTIDAHAQQLATTVDKLGALIQAAAPAQSAPASLGRVLAHVTAGQLAFVGAVLAAVWGHPIDTTITVPLDTLLETIVGTAGAGWALYKALPPIFRKAS